MVRNTVTSGEIIEFGPKRLESVPYAAINELQQVRTTYDSGAIDELAEAIQSGRDGSTVTSDNFELANPPLLGRHTPRSAQQYITEHGDYYRIPSRDRINYQDLTPLDDGTALILIAGHRRRRAVGRLLEMNNIFPEQARIAATVRDDIEFSHAVGLQLRENVYERPSPQDEARAIDLLYRYTSEKTGHAPSIKKLAAQLGVSETKARDALTFTSLPESIQEYTHSGLLSYTIVRQLRPLYDAFQNLYPAGSAADKRRKAELSLQEFCDTYLRRHLAGKSDEKLSLTITNRIKELQGQADYQQLSFDLLVEEQSVERRSDAAARNLAETAMKVVRYGISSGKFTSAELQEVKALLAAHETREEYPDNVIELPLDLADAS